MPPSPLELLELFMLRFSPSDVISAAEETPVFLTEATCMRDSELLCKTFAKLSGDFSTCERVSGFFKTCEVRDSGFLSDKLRWPIAIPDRAKGGISGKTPTLFVSAAESLGDDVTGTCLVCRCQMGSLFVVTSEVGVARMRTLLAAEIRGEHELSRDDAVSWSRSLTGEADGGVTS